MRKESPMAKKIQVDIGTIQTVSRDGMAGLIVPLDGGKPAFFDLSDKDALREEAEFKIRVGQIVQFVRDEAPGGDFRARRIALVDEAAE